MRALWEVVPQDRAALPSNTPPSMQQDGTLIVQQCLFVTHCACALATSSRTLDTLGGTGHEILSPPLVQMSCKNLSPRTSKKLFLLDTKNFLADVKKSCRYKETKNWGRCERAAGQEEIGFLFSGFDDHGPGSADVQHSALRNFIRFDGVGDQPRQSHVQGEHVAVGTKIFLG